MIKSTGRKLGSFSKRFNYLLDQAGYPPAGAGRAKALADRFGGSKSGAQNWIGKDLPPKRDTLRLIVAALLPEINATNNASQVVAWLENGNVVDDPFGEKNTIDINKLPIESKHNLLSKVYISVHNIAKRKDIDIYSLDDHIMDHVYNCVIQQAVESGKNDPDPYLITSLLELAVKSA
ncbi:MAG: hypothetical protein GXP08_17610 [Gammaproteobacteria bacterium]|nr:hypothetical protein [Gammaproteobacteria bacterium]